MHWSEEEHWVKVKQIEENEWRYWDKEIKALHQKYLEERN